jgi:Na+-translocating ferredoxin:NAD+ oxidoreductase subunit B
MTSNQPLQTGRRSFLIWMGRGLCTAALGGATARILLQKRAGAECGQPPGRYAWQIDYDKCTFCGKCATACVRKPSAVKAVNDQTKCSNCVVCYGHIYNHHAPSNQIDEQPKVCPYNAVNRNLFSGGLDGSYLYNIDDALCIGCGQCAKQCNTYGSRSMFLIIRPDLCLGCRECAIAKVCPSDALKLVSLQSATDARNIAG